MIIQLLKNGIPVLTATSGHQHGDSCALIPVTYEGHADFLPVPPKEIASASMVEDTMWRIALRHSLEVAGDHGNIIPKHRLVVF